MSAIFKIFTLGLLVVLISCNDSKVTNTAQNKVVTVISKDSVKVYQDTLDYSSFSDEQALEIGTIADAWNHSFRHQIYENHGVDHNCSDCESTSLLIELTINKEGLIERIDVLKNRIFCLEEKRREALKVDMVNSIQSEWKFTSLFALKIVQVRVGLVLKC